MKAAIFLVSSHSTVVLLGEERQYKVNTGYTALKSNIFRAFFVRMYLV